MPNTTIQMKDCWHYSISLGDFMEKKQRKLMTPVLRLKLLIVWLLLSNNVYALPPVKSPGIENEKTLMGVDANTNGVRDDVELFLYDGTYEDVEYFNAWMQKAKVMFKIIEFYPNISKMGELEIERQNAARCISLFKKKKKDTLNNTNLSELIFNTPERKKIISWWGLNYSTFKKNLELKEFKKEEVCK